MALKERKIPSPSNIKTTPQSFAEDEIKELRDLRNQLNQIVAQFGQLYVNKLKIEETEINLKKQFSTLEKKEIELGKKLSKKYGDGSIDLETGTFTPIK